VACFLLTGRPPYDRKTTAELCNAHLEAPLPRLREQLPELPAELESVILRCLAKHSALRYQRIDEVAAALRAAIRAGEWDSTAAAAWWRLKAYDA
jgi:serine/threonine-protein kinase